MGVDEVYYQSVAEKSLTAKVVGFARRRMYAHFVKVMQPGADTTIFDFGVSEHITDESNMLERLHPHRNQITCGGIGDGAEVKSTFPDVRYVSLEINAPLPFEDKSFDIGYSNAVFEHLDSTERRAFFFQELSRVARSCYITVPNRWFPIEHHSSIPLLHYAPALFRRVTRGGAHDFWSRRENLSFLSLSDLKTLAGTGLTGAAHTGLWLGPWSSNASVWSCEN